MLDFIFRLSVPTKFSISVRCTWQASTGFRRSVYDSLADARIIIQQIIFMCCLVSAPQPITSLHPLSSCTSIPRDGAGLRPRARLGARGGLGRISDQNSRTQGRTQLDEGGPGPREGTAAPPPFRNGARGWLGRITDQIEARAEDGALLGEGREARGSPEPRPRAGSTSGRRRRGRGRRSRPVI